VDRRLAPAMTERISSECSVTLGWRRDTCA
jgi:hypothetical protein